MESEALKIPPENNRDSESLEESVKMHLTLIFGQLLHMEKDEIEREIKFIDLGIDSIAGVEAVREINSLYGLNLDAVDLYDYPTIDTLGEYVMGCIEAIGKHDAMVPEAENLRILSSGDGGQEDDTVYSSTDLGADSVINEEMEGAGEGGGGTVWQLEGAQADHSEALYEMDAGPESSPDENFIPAYMALTLRSTEGLAETARTVEEGAQQTDLVDDGALIVQVADEIRRNLGEILHLGEGDADDESAFSELGLDSIGGVEMVRNINTALDLNLDAVVLYDHTTISKLAAHIAQEVKQARSVFSPEYDGREIGVSAQESHAVALSPERSLQKTRLPEMRKDTAVELPEDRKGERRSGAGKSGEDRRRDRRNQSGPAGTEIAVIGMSGRFPGAANLSEFWENLAHGRDCIEDISKDRFDIEPYYDAEESAPGTTYTKRMGCMRDVDAFDSMFFNIPPAEAELMDPQQRIFLEEAWKALEDTGYDPESFSGKRCGVFVGAGMGDYTKRYADSTNGLDAYTMMGSFSSILAARISYFLDLTGPSIAIDTACSSSLVAVHQGCRSILSGESDLVIAGGVYVQTAPDMHIMTSQAGMLSPDGKCKTFDDSADGFVIGEGVGVVVLKRLKNALADGDYIYGMIKGSGINQDGKTNGITAPSAKSQIALERRIYDSHGIDPEKIGYVEAHGTGTRLGDPIEVKALTRSFEHYTEKKGYCAIGSVKSNIGHCLTAAGISGLLKVLLCLKNQQLVPSLHYREKNKHIDFANGPFFVNTRLRPWKRFGETPRQAAISSFGFSGTNCHMVLEEAPWLGERAVAERAPGYVLVFSAKSDPVLQKRLVDFSTWLEGDGAQHTLADIAYTLSTGRSHFPVRSSVIVRTKEELKEKVRRMAQGQEMPRGCFRSEPGRAERKLEIALDELGRHLVAELSDPAGHDADSFMKKLSAVGELYVKGYGVDWKTLYGKWPGNRIPLPTYPFEKVRHWLPLAHDGEKQVDGTPTAKVWGPMIDERISDQEFSKTFRGGEFYLTNHRVQGRMILPGTAYLEMALEAGEICLQEKIGRIDQVVWLNPLIVSGEEAGCRIKLSREEREMHFRIETQGRDARVITNCTGRFAHGRNKEATERRVDIQAIRERCGRVMEKESCYALFADTGLNYGPAFQVIRRIRHNDSEALAELEFSASFEGGFGAFCLHPAVMDGALQSVLGILSMESGALASTWLPYAAERVSVYCPVEKRCFTHAVVCPSNPGEAEKSGDARQFDVTVYDEAGMPLVEIAAFTLRRAGSALQTTEAGALVYLSYDYEKAALDRRMSESQNMGDMLLFDMSDQRHALLKNRVAEAGRRLIRVRPGDDFKRKSATDYIIEPDAPDHYVRLRREIEASGCFPGHIIHMWSAGEAEEPDEKMAESTEFRLRTGFRSVFHLTRALMADPCTKTVRLVYGASGEDPLYAAMTGFTRTVGLEQPKFRYKSVCFTRGDDEPFSPDETEMARIVLAEMDDPSDDVHYRNGRRSVGRVSVQAPDRRGGPSTGTAVLRRGGVYLITGGAGGIGMIMAEYLARTWGVRLVLSGRSAPDDRIRGFLERLKKWGGEGIYVASDITRGEGAEGLIDAARLAFGELHGVIHSAGVISDTLTALKTPEEMARVVAPKVYGTLNLDRAVGAEPLDFFAMFSSTTALSGNPGQCDYAFASAFMDHFAGVRRKMTERGERFGKTVSVNWPLWKDGGMRVDAATEKLAASTLGMVPMSRENGVAAFVAALGADDVRVTVVQGDPEKIRERFGAIGRLKDEAAVHVTPESPTHDDAGAIGMIEDDVIRMVAHILKMPPDDIDSETELSEYGFDSIRYTQLANEINERFGVRITPPVFFEHRKITDLSGYLWKSYGAAMAALYGISPVCGKTAGWKNAPSETGSDGNRGRCDGSATDAPVETESWVRHIQGSVTRENRDASGVQPVVETVGDCSEVGMGNTRSDDSKAKLQAENTGVQMGLTFPRAAGRRSLADYPIAVVGMSGVMPMSDDLEEFWDNLVRGQDMVSEIPDTRWNHDEYYGKPTQGKERTQVRCAGLMKAIDKFDAEFFGISPREADLMDPQQRIMLETVWKTIEDAGHKVSDLAGTATGLFIGAATSDYKYLMDTGGVGIEPYIVTGNTHSITSNRISYLLDLKGPSETVDTACSSSLVALKKAVDALVLGDCKLAIAGGVNVIASPQLIVGFSRAGMLSADGRCKTFDRKADGYVRSEGCGALLLKPLDRALADRNHIYGLIRGISQNHGGHANSLTSPNPEAQAGLIARALNESRIDPSTITYIEAHGTGTSLGDPIEINGLKKAFPLAAGGTVRCPAPSCGIGSVKSNIGHLETAAGMASIIKVLLSMKHRLIPGNLHFDALNPYIELDDTPFYIVDKNELWRQVKDCKGKAVPRRAGISSFGFGGANAHVIIEEYDQDESGAADTVMAATEPSIITLSAVDFRTLRRQAGRIADYCKSRQPEANVRKDSGGLRWKVTKMLVETLGAVLHVDGTNIDQEVPLEDYGLKPATFSEFAFRINEIYGTEVIAGTSGILGTLNTMVEKMLENHGEKIGSYYGVSESENPSAKTAVPRLLDIAYTLQHGREEMDCRIAFPVSGMGEMVEKLLRFSEENTKIDDIFMNEVNGEDAKYRRMFEGKEGAEFIKSVIRERNYSKLCFLWTTGVEVDWRMLEGDGAGKRISLPSQPFRRQRHWFTSNTAKAGVLPATGSIHPLVHRNVSTLETQKFATILSGNEFFLEDHVVKGEKWLPGAAMIEMARAAGEISKEEQGISSMTDITWSLPVRVFDSPNEVQVALFPTEKNVEFEISCGHGSEGGGQVCCTGCLMDEDNAGRGEETLDLAGIKDRCNRSLDGEACYRIFKEAGLAYGPAFRVVENILYNDKEALAEIELTIPERTTSGDFYLHPTLLDGAFQTIAGFVRGGGTEHSRLEIPFLLKKISWFSPLRGRCYVHMTIGGQSIARPNAVKSYDIAVARSDGRMVVKMEGFTTRSAHRPPEKEEQWDNVLYFEPIFEQKSLDRQSVVDSLDTLLVLESQGGMRECLADESGETLWKHMICVSPGESFKKNSPTDYRIGPSDRKDYQRLIESIRQDGFNPGAIVHAWGAEVQESEGADLGNLVDRSFFSLLYLVQSMGGKENGIGTRLLYFHCPWEDRAAALHPALEGFIRTVRLENPAWRLKIVELPFAAMSALGDQVELFREIVAGELCEPNFKASVVKYAGERRLVRNVRPFEFDMSKRGGSNEHMNSTSTSDLDVNVGAIADADKDEEAGGCVKAVFDLPVRMGGTYVITGGAGRIGQLMAEHFAEEYKARLVLTGRRPASEAVDGLLAEISRKGGEAIYLDSDISDPAHCERIVAEAKSRFGGINGVLHCAGVTRDSLTAVKTVSDARAVFLPKIHGTLHLDRVTESETLDFMVFFSSTAGIIGNIGQCDYAFANGFMDHFAEFRNRMVANNRRHGKTLSINWPLWQDGGMDVDDNTRKWLKEKKGVVGISTKKAVAALEKGLAGTRPRYMVLQGSRDRILRAIDDEFSYKTAVGVEQDAFDPSEHPAFQVKVEAYLKALFADFFNMNVADVDVEKNFERFGVDSLGIIEIGRELENDLTKVPVNAILESGTIRKLSEYIVETFPGPVRARFGFLPQ
ncbi:MAG: SDR family NAD(P)-dependent oxidoreductase [Desulfobacteraceae bacterium]|jgi:polyketide synthase PksN